MISPYMTKPSYETSDQLLVIWLVSGYDGFTVCQPLLMLKSFFNIRLQVTNNNP